MEFVTIHDLSRELNIAARVIRYRLINLIADGKFKENEDFRRDDFKDEQHFVWKIQPLRFMQETGMKPALPLPVDNKVDNQPAPPVNQVVNKPEPIDNSRLPTGNQAGNNVDTKAEDDSLAREMIDLLKDQIRVKDGQLREQGEQLKETHELNVKLTGTMLQQAQEIKNLLRLTGGKTESADFVTKEPHVDNEIVNDNESAGNQSDALGNQPRDNQQLPRAA